MKSRSPMLGLMRLLGAKTIHAPIALEVLDAEKAKQGKQHIINVLKGEPSKISFEMIPLNRCAEEATDLTTIKIVGGNLTKLAQSVAYDAYPKKEYEYRVKPIPSNLALWKFETKNKVVLIEDIYESAEAIKVKLEWLYDADFFKNCVGVVFGKFNHSPDEILKINKVLKEFAERLAKESKHCWRSNDFGHYAENHSSNIPILLGHKISMLYPEKDAKTGKYTGPITCSYELPALVPGRTAEKVPEGSFLGSTTAAMGEVTDSKAKVSQGHHIA